MNNNDKSKTEQVYKSKPEWFQKLFTVDDVLQVAQVAERSDSEARKLANKIAHEAIWYRGKEWNPYGGESYELHWAGCQASNRFKDNCYYCP